MKLISTFVLLTLMCFGCVRNKSHERRVPVLRSGGVANIQQECDQLAKTGNILQVLSSIEKANDKIITIVEEGLEEEDTATLEAIGEQLNKDTDALISLTKPEWNINNLKYMIEWKIQDSVYGPKLKDVYFRGESHPEFMEYLSVTRKGKEIIVRFKTLGTLLEYCQLSETLMVVVEVKEKKFGEEKQVFYNLHMKK